MEKMSHPYLKLVKDCIAFARKFLCLPKQINIFFEDCPSERFPTAVNAAESDGCGNLWFNKPWFTGKDRWNNHKDDIEFFTFHELRHMHQLNLICLYLNGGEVSDSPETILRWKADFDNYKRNVGGDSQDANLAQEVEIDANAYAVCLSNLYHLEDDIELHFSAPEQATDIAVVRANQYKNKPEIQKYILSVKRERQAVGHKQPTQKQIPVRKTKIGRNELCPCGSGLKYKHCTCKQYHS